MPCNSPVIDGRATVTTCVSKATVAVAIMISNHLVIPVALRRRNLGAGAAPRAEPGTSDLGGYVLAVRRAAIVAVVLVAYAYSQVAGEVALALRLTGKRPEVDLRAQVTGALRFNLAREEFAFDKFAVNNSTSNYVFVQPGAGSLTVSNSTFTDAPVTAVSMSGSGALSVSESLFNNSNSQAINYAGSSATILGSSFIANKAGAVQILGGTTTVTNSLFQDNIITKGTESALSLSVSTCSR